MSEHHNGTYRWPKKIAKELNPLEPGGLAVDIIGAAGRPTAGLSLPFIGPSIQANSEEALDFAKRDILNSLGHPDYQGRNAPPKHLRKPASPKEGSTDGERQAGDQSFPIALPPKPFQGLAPLPPINSDPKPEQAPLPEPPAASPESSTDHTKTAPEQKKSEAPADPRAASLVAMASAPIDNPGKAALLKPVEKWTQPEMMDAIHSAQGDYRGFRSGDPLKAHTYEKVQDWHVAMYGDAPQGNDGGKPIEPQPIRSIPQQASPHTTPDGRDLWQATAKIGQQVADAAGTDGYDNAVKGLQRGLNILNASNPLPGRSPAYGPYTKLGPVIEDGQYGPQTDFALKHATARLGSAKVQEGLALGRFNTFARQAQSSGNADGLESATHGAFIRRLTIPDAIFTTQGLWGILKAKLFWFCVPQLVGLFIGIGVVAGQILPKFHQAPAAPVATLPKIPSLAPGEWEDALAVIAMITDASVRGNLSDITVLNYLSGQGKGALLSTSSGGRYLVLATVNPNNGATCEVSGPLDAAHDPS